MPKYLSSESGLEVTDALRDVLKKALSHEGKQSLLAVALSETETNIGRWLGTAKSRNDKSISWEKWSKIRHYLLAHGDIEACDPRYMLPSEMRAALLKRGRSELTKSESELLSLFRRMNDLGQDITLDAARSNAVKPGLSKLTSASGQAGEEAADVG